MNRLENLKEILIKEELTCALSDGTDIILRSKEKGVMPLYHFIQTAGISQRPLFMADKIIGKATAYLALYAGVKQIYTHQISEGGLHILQQNGIEVFYDNAVPYIYNRMQTGQCPMESSLEGVTTVEEAWQTLDRFIKNREGQGACK